MRGTRLMRIGAVAIVVGGLPQPAGAVSTLVPRHAAAFEWPHQSALAVGSAVAGNHSAAQAGAPASAAAAPGKRPGTIGVLPRVLVGNTPQDAVFDPATRTVYVANQGDNTMSVANARTCNARVTAGCGRQAPAFPAGSGPFGIGLDQATHTIYVADSNSDTVSVFNAATCNAAHTAGCRRALATVKVGGGPANIAVDPATGTVYVTITGTGISGIGDTVAVIDGATCNAANTSGCGHQPATVPLGTAGFFIAFDATNQTVYVTDPLTSKVSMINTRGCHAGHTAGCGRRPPTAAAGPPPSP
jgi:YVTN family beta-propeller protein